MTVSDQSTTTGFGDSQPVMQSQRQMSDNSTLSGVPSGEMPGRTGAPSSHTHIALWWLRFTLMLRGALGCATLGAVLETSFSSGLRLGLWLQVVPSLH